MRWHPHPRHLFRCLTVAAGLALGACHQTPQEVDGHAVSQTLRANGKPVHVLTPNQDDLARTVAEGKDAKQAADQVVFTPEEQAKAK